MTVKCFCMLLRINIDCNGCYRKVKRALLEIPEIETNMIEKKQSRVIVCGRFIPQDVAIKIKKKSNRRVEILEIQEMNSNEDDNKNNNNAEYDDQKAVTNHWTVVATQNQIETCPA
ncbi:hypothetical protein L6164_005322 [Bauhinia variegata]|uniref:Uncharacterized protein n=1 Tax=Bauhinia variegata TaxID=167791 RepID=A0ACB9PSD1_BAUVA|nr:hypothetical protein L6164_005322 [Bauhinia variegata]